MGVLRAYGSPGHEFGAEDIAYLQASRRTGGRHREREGVPLLADLDATSRSSCASTTHELRSPCGHREPADDARDGFVAR